MKIIESYIVRHSITVKDNKQWPISMWKSPSLFVFYGHAIQDDVISYGSNRYLTAYYVHGRDA